MRVVVHRRPVSSRALLFITKLWTPNIIVSPEWIFGLATLTRELLAVETAIFSDCLSLGNLRWVVAIITKRCLALQT